MKKLMNLIGSNLNWTVQLKDIKTEYKWEQKMEKYSLKKITENHSIAMILCCAIPLISITILSKTGTLGSWGYYSLLLLCPLLHVFMMRGHIHHTKDNNEHPMIRNEQEKK
ncbi:DUF2933 domain-containing protein [Thermodesulfobacteriota bacterium]